jgi:hypothetical protein
MLKPIYFPFTNISKPVFDGINTCFRQTIVYQPSELTVPENLEKWSDSHRLEIRIPVKGDEERLATILKDYNDWAKIHQEKHGLKHAFIRAVGNTTPFFDDTSSSKIKADIKGISRGDDLPQRLDSLFNARVFLALAQEFDLQNEALSHDLNFLGKLENDLINNIRGDSRPDSSFTPWATEKILAIDDSSDYMIPQRITAWTRLMQSDQHLDPEQMAGIFITSSRSVISHLLDSVSHAEQLYNFENIPVTEEPHPAFESWQNNLMDSLHLWVTNPWPFKTEGLLHPPAVQRADRTVSLAFYMVPGETPGGFFSRYGELEFPAVEAQNKDSRFKNILIAYLDAYQSI